MDERRKENKLKNMIQEQNSDKLDKILGILNGNGKIGLVAKVQIVWEWMSERKKTSAGLMDWVFRIVISLTLAYIAVQIGLKQ